MEFLGFRIFSQLLRDSILWLAQPNAEALGYCHLSLRDSVVRLRTLRKTLFDLRVRWTDRTVSGLGSPRYGVRTTEELPAGRARLGSLRYGARSVLSVGRRVI
jgi:hypothetical protein